MKRIAMIAFDCNPTLESESLLSFNTAYYLSKYYDVTMFTRPKGKEAIDSYMKNHPNSHLSFVYLDCPKYKKLTDRVKSIFYFYFLSKYENKWMKEVVNEISNVDQSKPFDVIYRITPNSFRVLPDLSGFDHCYKILGPVGGAQEIPDSLVNLATGKNKLVEKLHRKQNQRVLKSKKYQRKLKIFDEIYCCNEETYLALKPLLNSNQNIQVRTDVGIDKIAPIDESRQKNNPVMLLWVGRFMFRKGLDFLLNSLKEIQDENFVLTLVGDGPDLDHIKSKTIEYGLQDKIVFTGRIEHSRINQYFEKSDYFVFPSLRESSGNVLIEALSNRLPVIALNIGGAKTIVKPNEGILVDIEKDYPSNVKAFASAVKEAIHHEDWDQHAFDEAESMTWLKKIEMVRNDIEENKKEPHKDKKVNFTLM